MTNDQFKITNRFAIAVLNFLYSYKSDKNHLKYSLDFKSELQLYLMNQSNYKQYLRVICLIALAIGYILTILSWPLIELVTLFSNITMHIQTASLVCTILAARTVYF